MNISSVVPTIEAKQNKKKKEGKAIVGRIHQIIVDFEV